MLQHFPELPPFNIEDFMKSITYPPRAMSTGLARHQVGKEQEGKMCSALREAEMFCRALQLLPIGIGEADLIAGNYGEQFADEAYIKEAAAFQKADYDHSEEYLVHSEDERLASSRYMLFGIYTPAHTCVDYGTLLELGLGFYEKQIQNKLEEEISDYSKAYLHAMLKACEGVFQFASRYEQLARQHAKTADQTRRKQLNRMADALAKVPREPARDFFEALQSIWIIHTVTPVSERSWASISLGRMDQYLLPYYRKWLEEGNTRQEAKTLLCTFFQLLDSYGDGSCALNLGSDYNELSELILEVEKTVKLRSPIIAARMSKNTPPKIWEKFVDRELFKIGQPTFYQEENCIQSVAHRGVAHPESFAVNSCMGKILPGEELADMWGCCVNMNLPLELAVNNGQPLHGKLPTDLQGYVDFAPYPPTSMENIRASYMRYLQGVVAYVVEINLQHTVWIAFNRPNPFLSLLTKDCIENGRDRAQGAVQRMGSSALSFLQNNGDQMFSKEELLTGNGARYHNVTVLAMGFAHVADAFAAMEELVFTRGQITLEELIKATQANFEGPYFELYAKLLSCPKYASGSDVADEYAAFVLQALADACESLQKDSIRYLPTCHTIDANAQFGKCVYASFDGRRDGEAFGKNAGAVMHALQATPTDLIHGAAKLPQYRFSGGVPIDIYFPDGMLATPENRKKVADLIKVYFNLGGMQVQVNSVDVALLKKAYENPKDYPHVIVRKGGFSLYFADMLPEVQADMIARFEREGG